MSLLMIASFDDSRIAASRLAAISASLPSVVQVHDDARHSGGRQLAVCTVNKTSGLRWRMAGILDSKNFLPRGPIPPDNRLRLDEPRMNHLPCLVANIEVIEADRTFRRIEQIRVGKLPPRSLTR